MDFASLTYHTKKTYRESILLVSNHYLICPQKERLVGPRKHVSRPFPFLWYRHKSDRCLLAICLVIQNDSRQARFLLAPQPVSHICLGPCLCVCAREGGGSSAQSFYLFLCFQLEKKTTTAVYSFAGPPMYPIQIRQNPGPYCCTY